MPSKSELARQKFAAHLADKAAEQLRAPDQRERVLIAHMVKPRKKAKR